MNDTTFEIARLDPKKKDHWQAAEYIARNLRPADQFECAAVGCTQEQLIAHVQPLAAHGEAYIAWFRGEPVWMWGVWQTVPGVFQLWGVGTEKTRRIMPALTRWGLGAWLPEFMVRANVRRIEVRVPYDSVHSVRWLMKLGMSIEATLPNYGVHGEDFFQLSITRLTNVQSEVASADLHSPASAPASPQ